ncbi:uncharacterized protein BCR38DRAFT_342878 [Pseudomassariella vexata]|uniref:GET complex, subunit GET2 n=1 Tax=Pseudomassariella vexata TaxID=1141098 RepID=A0A1Y2DXH7_9PEZI|nr:uncharacterized protein BCR38DRAFT_342878 [Pseudomassariella vexata]ORY63992.1 hypothetical protein BCR38DRAFT_342878 [Pseudomassariella vexata]
MTETVQAPEDAAAARAAEQVRLRKERREAKIKAGGASRLNKITGLGGGVARDPQPQPQTQAPTPPPPQPTPQSNHEDPDEVDISQHYYDPRTTGRALPAEPSLSEAQLRQMMLGFEPPPGSSPNAGAQRNPFARPGSGGGGSNMAGVEDDPMMKMMQQMMGGAAGAGGNPFVGTGMEGLFGGAGGLDGMQQAQQAVTDKPANIWRIVHAVFALGLGLYVALSTTFTGTKTEREALSISATLSGHSIEQTRAYFFYLFTSVEAVLLTSRFFLDKNRAPPSGVIWSITGFLPGQFKSGVRHALKYGQILSTVRSDALVCVFVLGVCCWLRS